MVVLVMLVPGVVLAAVALRLRADIVWVFKGSLCSVRGRRVWWRRVSVGAGLSGESYAGVCVELFRGSTADLFGNVCLACAGATVVGVAFSGRLRGRAEWLSVGVLGPWV